MYEPPMIWVWSYPHRDAYFITNTARSRRSWWQQGYQLKRKVATWGFEGNPPHWFSKDLNCHVLDNIIDTHPILGMDISDEYLQLLRELTYNI